MNKEKFTIRSAEKNELDRVQDFYYSVIDQLEGSAYGPKWTKDVYPAREDFKNAVLENTMYVCENQNGKIYAAMVLNSKCDEAYAGIEWKVKAEPDQVYLIHLLCVDQRYKACGIGLKMVQFAIKKAKETDMKAVRLDVIKGNMPAENLYVKCGFKFIKEMTLYYEDTGWAEFRMYEFEVK